MSHWAASTRGYPAYGAPQASGDAQFGDLGARGLDLAALWEYFRDVVRPGYTGAVQSLFASWVGSANIGSFGNQDLLADVDAYLCANRVIGHEYRPVSDIVREIECGVVLRFESFVNERFGSRANVISSVKSLFSTSNLVTSIPVILKSGLPLPAGSDLQGVADGFADALYARV
ncbi:hypothetical protein ITJ43_03970 [Microbacterium sp. VKM Ac-2870]|uniref:hypothetical protein n=1 Tax=Microbacterium sp. VKM Ac-2870 TaxID=2783825 RepID=UPI001889CAD2|nr:hypothetical protein [Microbacterium sp. VKM Ac-2870]MBF4561283.1 hypothetical protein [Microbacterium sp. VKM Ac-2870]